MTTSLQPLFFESWQKATKRKDEAHKLHRPRQLTYFETSLRPYRLPLGCSLILQPNWCYRFHLVLSRSYQRRLE